MWGLRHMRREVYAFLWWLDLMIKEKSIQNVCMSFTVHVCSCIHERDRQLWRVVSGKLKGLPGLWDLAEFWTVRTIMCFYNASLCHNSLCFRPFQCLENVGLLFCVWRSRKNTWPGQPFRAFDRKLMVLNVRLIHNEWAWTGCEGSASREHLGQTKMPFLPWDLCPGTRCHQRPAHTQLQSIQARCTHSSRQSCLQKVTLSAPT